MLFGDKFNLSLSQRLGEFKDDSEKLENISIFFEMIAILVTNQFDTYVLFRFSSAIKYCTLDEVNTHFNEI